ncbi:hypothetical protein L914_02855 [Phytophthora nicotianae]|uniref:Uncharacterized protein n=1 Tax=Phytophthora nicotianae TaxID=4792 RepID=W2NYR0_PHYNI|nr:hypothetical protein L914_02855 [Phytophthora nicotianae]
MGLVLWGVSPFEGNRSDVVPQIGGSDALETKAYYEPGVAPEEHIWEGECLIKDWTSKTTGEFYVDAFARGMKTKISAQVVRPAKPPTLKQGVGFAIENSSKYGEGAR